MSGKRTVNVCSPGKVILHGEHAVVYCKKAVAVSVSLFTSLDIRVSDESDEISLLFPAVGLDLNIKLSDIKSLQSRLGDNFKFSKLNEQNPIPLDTQSQEIIQEFTKNLPFFSKLDHSTNQNIAYSSGQIKATEAFLGLYAALFNEAVPLLFEIKTELPVGAGLGSSASFGAALVTGILRWTGEISKELNDADRLKINRWAFFSEKFVHGTPSGIDNHVATYGGAVVFQRKPEGQGEAAEVIPCPEIRVILVDTKVSRSTHQVIQKVNELKARSLDTWKKIIDDIGLLVERAVEEIRQNNSMKSQLFLENHELLQSLGASHAALDKIVGIGGSFGFHGKLTGAGGGGCAFIFIPAEAKEEAVTSLKSSLTDSGFHFWETQLGCSGVRLEENYL